MGFLQQTSSLGLRSLKLNIHSIKPSIIPTLYSRSFSIAFKPQFQIQQHQQFTKLQSQVQARVQSKYYSTKTAPPPPQPKSSHDKNVKGKKLLHRISRAFTFSLSTLLVIGAAGVAILVVSLILSELFLPSGDTRTFNKAVRLIEENEQAQKALVFPNGERLKAYGIVAADRWVRNRPVQSVKTKHKDGKDHLLMKFQVESDSGNYGVVTLEQVDNSMWSTEFEYIALDVPGFRRIYIIEPPTSQLVPKIGGGSGFLGLNWGPKKD